MDSPDSMSAEGKANFARSGTQAREPRRRTRRSFRDVLKHRLGSAVRVDVDDDEDPVWFVPYRTRDFHSGPKWNQVANWVTAC